MCPQVWPYVISKQLAKWFRRRWFWKIPPKWTKQFIKIQKSLECDHLNKLGRDPPTLKRICPAVLGWRKCNCGWTTDGTTDEDPSYKINLLYTTIELKIISWVLFKIWILTRSELFPLIIMQSWDSMRCFSREDISPIISWLTSLTAVTRAA